MKAIFLPDDILCVSGEKKKERKENFFLSFSESTRFTDIKNLPEK